MSLLLSEEVQRYREYEVEMVVKIMKQVLDSRDTNDFQYNNGRLEAMRQIINLPNNIASTPEEKLYAKEMIGKTKELLANRIADKYLFEP